jgi:3'-phosphoadenosine 5'-phosphosulfate sulfotransferase (PAPS reductase)/FAD synthetase
MVNLHMLAGIAPEVPVVFVDTLYHFEETLELANVVSEKYGLDVRIYRPPSPGPGVRASTWRASLGAGPRCVPPS